MITYLIILGLVLWFVANIIALICYVIVIFEDAIDSSIFYWLFFIFGFIVVFTSWYWWGYCLYILNS